MEYIRNEKNVKIAEAICEAIHENAAYLSVIDGAIGDGDHGVNMNKGFLMARERLRADMSFSESMNSVKCCLFHACGSVCVCFYTNTNHITRKFCFFFFFATFSLKQKKRNLKACVLVLNQKQIVSERLHLILFLKEKQQLFLLPLVC